MGWDCFTHWFVREHSLLYQQWVFDAFGIAFLLLFPSVDHENDADLPCLTRSEIRIQI
jgi:hypothetical protein